MTLTTGVANQVLHLHLQIQLSKWLKQEAHTERRKTEKNKRLKIVILIDKVWIIHSIPGCFFV